MDKNDPEVWRPFVSDSIDLNKMTAEQKMNVGGYLHIQNSSIQMTTGFKSHKCDFWGYTNSGLMISLNCLFLTFLLTIYKLC